MNTNSPSSCKSNRFKNRLLSRLIGAGSRIAAIVSLMAACAASGQTVPSLMNYQGKLLDVTGNPMASGRYDVVFKIWKKANPTDPADALVWGQTNPVTIVNGIFNVALGGASGVIGNASKTNLVDAFDEAQRYLSLTIVRNPSGTVASPAEILPRQQMLSAPYALKTAVATDALTAYNGVPPGSILPFGGTNVPSGFLLCDGTPVSRSTYPSLFSVIGTAWGAGDGFNTFHLPDLRGMFLRGVNGSRTDTNYWDPDVSLRTNVYAGGNVGNAVGSVQTDEFRSHTHRYWRTQGGTSSGGNPNNIAGNYADTDPTGGNETRPKNVYVNYIIKY